MRAVVLVALLVPSILGAQLGELTVGQRVRLEAPGIFAGRFEGTILSRSTDTLVVARPGGVQQRVAVGSLTSAEVSRGKSRTLGAQRGALWGGGIAGALGLAIAIPASTSSDTTFNNVELAGFVAQMFLGGALWGAGIGAAVGAEKWDRFALPARVSILPARGGVRLAMRWMY